LEKYAIKFDEKTSSGSRGAPYERVGERTDRRDEASSYFLKFSSKSLKITLNFWTWKRVESRSGQALLNLAKMQWGNEIIYVREQPVHIPGNDYLLKVTKISFAHKLNPTSDNDSVICNWHPIVIALN